MMKVDLAELRTSIDDVMDNTEKIVQANQGDTRGALERALPASSVDHAVSVCLLQAGNNIGAALLAIAERLPDGPVPELHHLARGRATEPGA